MEIHPDKTHVLHFGHGNEEREYTLNGIKISAVTSTRDLGITINNSCSPSEHVTMIARKANGVLSQLHRTLLCRNKETFIGLFKTFVRPIMESSGAAWSPWERQDINCLEKVQRRATRLVPGLGKMTYEERLEECNLITLEHRRERGDMIEVYKMTQGFTDVTVGDFFNFTNERHDAQTRSAINKHLVPEKCRLDVRKHFFANRVVHAWNALPIDIREAESINGFKNNYDDWIRDMSTN